MLSTEPKVDMTLGNPDEIVIAWTCEGQRTSITIRSASASDGYVNDILAEATKRRILGILGNPMATDIVVTENGRLVMRYSEGIELHSDMSFPLGKDQSE